MRLIDADTLIEDLEYDIELDARALDCDDVVSNREIIQFDKECKQNCIDLLRNTPTVDPVKHGRWKPFDLTWGRSIYYCTSCGDGCEVPTEMEKPIYEFCPNCGAYMMDEVSE